MKIVHIRSNFDPGIGYDTLAWPLEQLKIGHDVVVITTDRASASAAGAGTLSQEDTARLKLPYFEVQGLKVYRLRSSRVGYDDLVIPYGGPALLERLKPDVVQVTAAREMMPLFAAMNKKRLGYRLFTREDQYDFPASTPFRRFLVKTEFLAWRRYWCDYFYNKCDGIFETSLPGIDFLKRYHHIKSTIPIKYMPVIVDQSRFFPDKSKRKALRKKLCISDNTCLLVSVGKVFPLKRVEVLVRAMARVPANVRAWIIGGGDPAYIESLKSLASSLGCAEKVRFLPNTPHEELPAYYNAADIGFWNRSTSSIQEAMSCGLPTIVSSYVAKVLPEYNSCQVFAEGSVDGLASGITLLATDRKYAKEVSARCLAKARECFDISKQARELIEMYESSLKKRD